MGAIDRGLFELHLRYHHFRAFLQLGAQDLAQVGHGLEIGDVAVMDPLHYLVRAVTLLAQPLGKEILQALAVEVQQVLLAVRRNAHRLQREKTSVAAKK